MPLPVFAFDNTYARELEGFYVSCKPAAAPAPRLVFFNRELATTLGLAPQGLEGLGATEEASELEQEAAACFAGNALPEGAQPIAQAYAGHQFGGFSPQLGDGRALLLGEVINRRGQRRDIAFKGSGRTPFSRGGDGKAALGPMLREVIMGESMHALGIPTTRALAVVATGEPVYREQMLPGAVLTRVAASHLRVGTFQFFAARRETDRVRQLADYAISRHDPSLSGDDPGRFLALLHAVAARQAALVARWMNVGFIHGVMNTDNMTLSGETIDYGPCAFMEAFDPATVFSSIDHGGRYAYANQPAIARWNLARLAETLLPLLDEDSDRAVAQATEVIDAFFPLYESCLLQGQRARLGLAAWGSGDGGETGSAAARQALDQEDATLAQAWLDLMHQHRVDFTLGWRHLADAAAGDEAPLRALFPQAQAPEAWLQRWRDRLLYDPVAGQGTDVAAVARAQAMRAASPWIIPRNHRVEDALKAASDDDDFAPFERLLQALRRPFQQLPEDAAFAEPAPAAVTAGYRTFCGT